MATPTAIAAVLAAVGAFDAAAALGVQHVVMVPAMLGVMLWRYEEYAKICPTDDAKIDRERLRAERILAEEAAARETRRRLLFGYVAAGVLASR